MTVAVERGGGATPQHLTRIKSTGEEKIYVTVRVRPLSGKEIARSDVSDWECTNNHTIAFKHALPERSPFPATYTFGKVTFLKLKPHITKPCLLHLKLLYNLTYSSYIISGDWVLDLQQVLIHLTVSGRRRKFCNILD